MVRRSVPKLLILSLVVVLATMILPASAANKVEFRANGKVTSYYNYDPENPGSSMVVGGNWNIHVKDGGVDFQLFYKEMNLIPEGEGGAPAGSVDQFRITLIEKYYVEYAPSGYCYLYGRFNVDKLAWLPEGSTPRVTHIYNFFGDIEGWVYITPDYMEFEALPWHILGTTTSMK